MEALTNAVRDFLLAPTQAEGGDGDGDEETPPKNVEEVAERFLSAYEESVAKQSLTPEWKLERKVFVHHASETVVSLGFLERSYMGAAHGEETLRFLNVDARNGKPVVLVDVLHEGARGMLLALAEPRFRAVHGIEDGATLRDAGFTFGNDSFDLTDNYGIGDHSLTFYYNTYEVGPYTLGPTEIVLGPEVLAGLWKEETARSRGEPQPTPAQSLRDY
jgi:hypothetical protein